MLANDPSDLTTISAPVKNRGSGTWDIYLARRINGPQGAFVGLVLGAMSLPYFEHLYDSISMAGNMHICLWRSDGTLLARFPPTAFLGRQVPSRAPLLSQAPGKTILRPNFAGSEGRLMIAAQKLVQHGLVVEVSETMDDVLADWRHEAYVVGFAGVSCVAATVLLMLALIRQFRTYDAMAEAIAAREEAVAARQRAEQRLLEAQKMEAIGRLTSGIAHDFNNLLGAITGNVELMQRDPKLGNTATRRLSVIQQAADRGAGLIRQLLAFSRQQVLVPAPVMLETSLIAMLDLLEGTVGPEVQVNIAVEPRVWAVMVDPTQFEYMMLNLAVNARDAMPNGGRLTISAKRVPSSDGPRPEGLPQGDFVAIAVADTGMGMPADVMRKAFDPFFTTKGPGRGSGLGLSQVYGLANQSGGLAQLASIPGRGTTVTVFLPRATLLPTAEQTERKETQGAVPS
jgi:signal transduction histidine kinase